jgi:hypothetical protein
VNVFTPKWRKAVNSSCFHASWRSLGAMRAACARMASGGPARWPRTADPGQPPGGRCLVVTLPDLADRAPGRRQAEHCRQTEHHQRAEREQATFPGIR